MSTHVILKVTQDSESGRISLNSSIPNPLILLDILIVVQRQLVTDALNTMEVKKTESSNLLIN